MKGYWRTLLALCLLLSMAIPTMAEGLSIEVEAAPMEEAVEEISLELGGPEDGKAPENHTEEAPDEAVLAADGDDVPLDEAHFPDALFRLYISEEIDTDHNNVLSAEECSAVTSINTGTKEVASLQGIRYFHNLKSLRSNFDKLTSLDVSGCAALTSLDCDYNQLTELNVKGCAALKELSCYSNKLTNLDVSGCPALTKFSCANNQLSRLDVSSCPALTELRCFSNQLTDLNVDGCTLLTKLTCTTNQLTSLDVSGCPALVSLQCSSNLLTKLNVTGCRALSELYCSLNQLTSLDVSSCTALTELECWNNQLEELKVSGCMNLKNLNCARNPLKHLDLSECPNLNSTLEGESYDSTEYGYPYRLYFKGVYSLHCDPDLFEKEESILVSSITLNKTKTAMKVGKKLPLEATVLPEDATDPSLSWSTSDDTVATVSEAGKVTAKKAGKATITATAKDGGGASASCEITVEPTVKLNKTKAKLHVKASCTLKATVITGDGKDPGVTWKSSDKTVATASSAGKVTAKKRGKATITATAKDGSGAKATCVVTVTPKISLNKTKAKLHVNASCTLKATVITGDGKNPGVTWKSSDKTVATVSSAGKVTGKKGGTATITATVKGGNGAKATCVVTVDGLGLLVIAGSTRELGVGEKTTLAVTAPEGATIKWTSSDSKILKVSDKGVVTGVKKGKATITATSSIAASNGKKATYGMTVTDEQPATGVELDITKLDMAPGDAKTLKATLVPKDAKPEKFTWTSSNENVATVKAGKVTAVKAGKATITVKTASGKTAKCAVNIGEAKIEFRSKVWNLGYGETVDVGAYLTAGTGKISYSSSDKAVATISSKGKVTAYRKQGETTIKAEAEVFGRTISNTRKLYVYGDGKYAGFTSEPLDTTKAKFNANMLAVADDVVDVMDKAADKEIDTLEASVETIINIVPTAGVKFPPEEVEPAFEKKMKAVIETFDRGVGDYSGCKTDQALVKKIIETLAGGREGSFTFEAEVEKKKGTYTATVETDIPSGGGRFIGGWIIFPNGERFQWFGTSVSKKDIQDQMNYLKKYAEIKLEDAKKAVKEDVKKLLEIDKLETAMKDWLKGKASGYLQKEFPRVHGWLTEAQKVNAKYKSVKKTLSGVVPASLDGKLGPEVIKEIADYNNQFLAFIELVENLGGIDNLI